MADPKILQQATNGLLTLSPDGGPVPNMQLDTVTPDASVIVGSTYWDADEDTAVTHRSNGKAYSHGSELWKRCYNDSGAEIPNGTPVYVFGAHGDRPKITPASSATALQSKIIGVTTESIADRETGDVATHGDLNDLDTSGFVLGDEVWLGAAYGALTNVMPVGNYQRVFIGIVTRVHASRGRIQLAPYRYPMANELLRETWDDLSFLKGAKSGGSAPTYAQFGSTSFWGWKMASGNIFYADDAQISHAWDKLVIRPHIHFSSDNGGTGVITMEHRIMSRPAGVGTWSSEVISTKAWTGTLAAGGCASLDLYDGTGFQPASPGPSTLFKAVLTMAAKTFTGNIFIDGWDAHYKSDKFGTETEY